MARVLLGVTGSVAAIKVPLLVEDLHRAGHEVRLVATRAATYFFDVRPLREIVTLDADEWPGERYQRGDEVRHIELRRWGELFLVAPLDANTLAKFAVGLSDNCLTCVYRAWEPTRPVVLAPAMNTLMWQHPLTARHLRALTYDAAPPGLDETAAVDWINANRPRLRVVAPESRALACGDVGIGAMAGLDAIVYAVNEMLSSHEAP